MNSDKRFVLAVVLSFLILVFYPLYLSWISPAQKAPPRSQVEQPGTVETKPDLEMDLISEPKPEAPQEQKQQLYPFSFGPFRVQFSELG